MLFTQFMYKVVRVVAFGFKSLNFFLDIWQTWQFATGGSVAGITTGIIAYFQNKPVWLIVVLVIAVGIFVACIISLIFKSYMLENTEGKRLKRLSNLVYDMHRRRCAVREGFINKIDWSKVDDSKVLTPTFEWLAKEDQSVSIDDDTINDVASKLDEMGSMMHGAPSVLITVMKSSDTNIEKAVEGDFRYRVMQARLDNYKPFPSEVIRKDVDEVLFKSKAFNNVMVYQEYMTEPLTSESLAEQTKLSDVKKGQVYSTNVNVEEIMEDTIDKHTTRLSEHIEEYLKGKKKSK